MLISNKLVISYLPAPTFVSCIQLLVCIISILIASHLNFAKLDIVGSTGMKWLFLYSGLREMHDSDVRMEVEHVVEARERCKRTKEKTGTE